MRHCSSTSTNLMFSAYTNGIFHMHMLLFLKQFEWGVILMSGFPCIELQVNHTSAILPYSLDWTKMHACMHISSKFLNNFSQKVIEKIYHSSCCWFLCKIFLLCKHLEVSHFSRLCKHIEVSQLFSRYCCPLIYGVK